MERPNGSMQPRNSFSPSTRLKRTIGIAGTLLLCTVSILMFQLDGLEAVSEPRYWVASSPANWNDAANWSETSGGSGGAGVPDGSQVAVFDGLGTGDCTIDATADVSGLTIEAGYTGTISLNSQSLTVAEDAFLMRGGTFSGGAGSILIEDSLNISGGSFQSTSGTMTLEADCSITGSNFFHQNGTVLFDAGGNRNIYPVGSAPVFHNLTVDMNNNKAVVISDGDSIVVENKVTLTNGKINTGFLVAKDTCLVTAEWDNGNSTLVFEGDDAAWLLFDGNDWSGNDVVVNLDAETDTLYVEDVDGDGTILFGNNSYGLILSGGMMAFESGVTADLDFGTLTLNSGGNLLGADHQILFQGDYVNAGGIYHHNNGDFVFNSTGARSFSCVTSSDNVFHNIEVNSNNNKVLTITSGDSLFVDNKASLSNGKVNSGVLAVADTCLVNSGWDNGNATLLFRGSGNAWFLFDGNDWSGNDVHVSLESVSDTAIIGDVDGDQNIQVGNSSYSLEVKNGCLAFQPGLTADIDFEQIVLESGGTLIGSDQEVLFQGNYVNIGGAFVHNEGTFTFNGSGNRTFSTAASPAETFYHLQVSMGNNKALTISSGDSLHVQSRATLTNGKVNTGVLAVDDTCYVGSGWDNGDAILAFIGDDNAWFVFDGNDWSGNDVQVALATTGDTVIVADQDGDDNIQFGGSSNTLTVSGGCLAFEPGITADLNFGDLSLESGGRLVGSSNEILFQGNYSNFGGTYVHNNGRFTFDGAGNRSFSCSNIPTDRFYDLDLSLGNNKTLTITSGDSLLSLNKTTLTNGKAGTGYLAVDDTCLVESGWDNGNATLVFRGSNNAWLQFDGNDWSGNHVEVAFDGLEDTVFVQDVDGNDSLQFGSNSYSLTISGGAMAFGEGVVADMDFEDLTIQPGGMLIGSNAEIIFQGNYDNIGGSFVHNNGLFTFNGQGNRTFSCLNTPTDEFFDLNIQIKNNKSLTLSDTLHVSGDLIFTNGKVDGSAVKLEGDLEYVSFDGGSSSLVFSGNSKQVWNNNGAASSFNGNVYFMQTTADTIELSSAVTLDASGQNLTFEKGILTTVDTILLVIGDGVTVSGANDSSYVLGPVKKTGNEAFEFPVGGAGMVAPIGISAPSKSSDAFVAEYIPQTPFPDYDQGAVESGLQSIASCEYWMLDRTNGSSSVSLTLSWDSDRSCSVPDPTEVRVAGWDGLEWTDLGNSGTTGTQSEGTVTTASAVSTFGPMTLASSEASTMPVDLTYFLASAEAQFVSIEWQTYQEINNDFFSVERSVNGRDWLEVANVEGAGTSETPIQYQASDYEPPAGKIYYRLRQVDFDGTYSLSQVQQVNWIETGDLSISVYPNPVVDLLTVEASSELLSGVKVLDINGLDLSASIPRQALGTQKLQLDLRGLPVGIYFISTGDRTEKIFKE